MNGVVIIVPMEQRCVQTPCSRNYVEGREQWAKRGKKKKQRTRDTKYYSFIILYLYVIGYPMRYMVPLWSVFDPVAETEVRNWLKGPFSEPMTKWFHPQGSGTMWVRVTQSTRDRWLIGQLVRTSDSATSSVSSIPLHHRCQWVWNCMFHILLLVRLESGFGHLS